jgi:hypothetical protein
MKKSYVIGFLFYMLQRGKRHAYSLTTGYYWLLITDY